MKFSILQYNKSLDNVDCLGYLTPTNYLMREIAAVIQTVEKACNIIGGLCQGFCF